VNGKDREESVKGMERVGKGGGAGEGTDKKKRGRISKKVRGENGGKGKEGVGRKRKEKWEEMET